MNNMNTIPGLSSHMNTTNHSTMNTLSVTSDQVAGEIIYETNSASENSPDKDGVDIIFHSHFRRIHFHFFYTAGRGGQWAAWRWRHKTYNGIPFQLTEPTTLFSFQATSFPVSLSSGRLEQEQPLSNETKTNKKRILPNSTFNLCLRLDFLK